MVSIAYRRVSVRYPGSRKRVFSDLSLVIDERPTLLLGRNGAGKSTLLKLGAGILQPKTGSIYRSGRCVYLPQKFAAVPGLSCISYVSYLAWLTGQNRHRAKKDAAMWLSRVGLDGFETRPNTELSGGQQARLSLAMALNSGASIVLLDEPGAALDPLSKADLLDLYEMVSSVGTGILVSSHDPTDIQGSFERVLLVDDGRVVFDNSLQFFLESSHEDPLVASFSDAMRRGQL